MNVDATTGTDLRRRRQALGLSLNEVARRADISAAQLSLVERGLRQPSTHCLTRLTEVLELPALAAGDDGGGTVMGDHGGLAQMIQTATFGERAFEIDSRSQSLYARLRNAIVHGELRPNERLVEAALARALDVSRTPIRECLQRLAAEGFVDHTVQGWKVHEHTAAEIAEIYDVRSALEGYAAHLASQRATAEQKEEITRRSRAYVPRGEPAARFVERNERFHDAIIAAATNRHLSNAILQSRLFYFNHRLAHVYTEKDEEIALREHQAIAKSITAGNAAKAERLARDHVAGALEIVLRITS